MPLSSAHPLGCPPPTRQVCPAFPSRPGGDRYYCYTFLFLRKNTNSPPAYPIASGSRRRIYLLMLFLFLRKIQGRTHSDFVDTLNPTWKKHITKVPGSQLNSFTSFLQPDTFPTTFTIPCIMAITNFGCTDENGLSPSLGYR